MINNRYDAWNASSRLDSGRRMRKYAVATINTVDAWYTEWGPWCLPDPADDAESLADDWIEREGMAWWPATPVGAMGSDDAWSARKETMLDRCCACRGERIPHETSQVAGGRWVLLACILGLSPDEVEAMTATLTKSWLGRSPLTPITSSEKDCDWSASLRAIPSDAINAPPCVSNTG